MTIPLWYAEKGVRRGADGILAEDNVFYHSPGQGVESSSSLEGESAWHCPRLLAYNRKPHFFRSVTLSRRRSEI